MQGFHRSPFRNHFFLSKIFLIVFCYIFNRKLQRWCLTVLEIYKENFCIGKLVAKKVTWWKPCNSRAVHDKQIQLKLWPRFRENNGNTLERMKESFVKITHTNLFMKEKVMIFYMYRKYSPQNFTGKFQELCKLNDKLKLV